MINMAGILESLADFIPTFEIALAVALVIIMIVLINRAILKWERIKKEYMPENIYQLLRAIIIILPLIWIVLNFSQDINDTASFLFYTVTPLVIILLFFITLTEMAMAERKRPREE